MFLDSLKRKYAVSAIAIALALATTACGKDEVANQAQALPVDVAVVITQDVPVVSRLTGRANATRKAEVRPQVTGIIQERLFTEGSTVKQGDQLYQIDPAIYQANVDSAKANLASANATLHTAKLRADRYRRLLETKAVAKQDYDDAQATYLQAQASVEAAKANLQTAEINLAYTKVYAPISGRISKSEVTEGALVSAQQTTAMTTIQQLDPIYVDLGQSVEDHILLRKAIAEGKFKTTDGKAAVDLYFSNGIKYPHQGSLEFSEVSVDESTGMVNLRAIVPNEDNVILPGMFLRADLNEGVIPNATLVDQSAITREAGGLAYVYVIDDKGIAKRTTVTLAQTYQTYYVVSDGLKAGDKVITTNLQKVRDGTPVIDASTIPAKTEEQK